jgi:hypothetical protein
LTSTSCFVGAVPEAVISTPSGGGILNQLLVDIGTSLADLEQQVLTSSNTTLTASEQMKMEESGTFSDHTTTAVRAQDEQKDNDVAGCSVTEYHHPESSRPHIQPSNDASQEYNEKSVINGGRHQMNITIIKGSIGLGFCIEGGVGSAAGDRPVTVKRLFRSKWPLQHRVQSHGRLLSECQLAGPCLIRSATFTFK